MPGEQARLAEYRRLLDKILVLPGFEFTATFGFHILGIFPTEKPLREIEHLLLDLNIPPDQLDYGSATVGATTDVLSAYQMIHDAGGLVIAAHANSSNGVAMRGLNFGGQTAGEVVAESIKTIEDRNDAFLFLEALRFSTFPVSRGIEDHALHVLSRAVLQNVHHPRPGHHHDYHIDRVRQVGDTRVGSKALDLRGIGVHGIDRPGETLVLERQQEQGAYLETPWNSDQGDGPRGKQGLQIFHSC